MTENTTVAPDTDDLDAFEAALNGKAVFSTPEPDPEDVEVEVEDTDLGEDTTAEDEEASDDEGDAESDPTPPKKKQSLQERINEVIADKKSAQREAEAERSAREALEARLAALESSLSSKKEDTTEAAPQTTSAQEPQPTDLNEDGTEKYPLGEYDPKFAKDITKFTIEQTMAALEQENAAKLAAAEAEKVKTVAVEALKQEWTGKVEAIIETIPDFVEKGQALESTFSDLEPAYGEYLVTTIMAMEHGPEVLYYLANNVDEAHAIAAKGPVGATIALGRIEGLLAAPTRTETPPRKVSSAPEPPADRTRGSSPRVTTPVDTDDLDAFEELLYANKRK